MIARLKDLLRLSGGEWLVSFTTREDPERLFEKLKESMVSVDLKRWSKARSKTANDFCWAMCTDIGDAMNLPKEHIYRQAIRDAGQSDLLLCKNERVERFISGWNQKGIGWFAEVVDDSKKNKGCKVVMVYYGTSTYTADEMSKVLDYLKQDMQSLELPIPVSKAEEERMLKQWAR